MIDLLKYITEMPSETDSHERAHKYPFLVGDLLSIDNNSLLDVFFEEEREDTSDEEKTEPEVSPEKMEEEKVEGEKEEDMKTGND